MSDHKQSKNTLKSLVKLEFCYSIVLNTVERRYDVRGYILSQLIMVCLQNRAVVPPLRRVYFERYVQQEALSYLERVTARLLFGPIGRFSPNEYRYIDLGGGSFT
ncbi:hypothetical protein [Pseudomonas sp. GD03696]|uniref:hypothetical protein n=1 Tax=Pseudomonas sp. GD03696 TaxID=2975368 RepID=UPI00244A4F9B|nr:hypothetical protein [Pseudomonas sp. GD03696]MDH1930477.1 hypothetical protein [Pseudomonas sp. GD03696]